MMRVKKSGIKIHIAVDVLGLPYVISIATASVIDDNGAIEMLAGFNMPTLKRLLCGGYTGEDFAGKIKNLINAEVEIAKRPELHKFMVMS